MKEVVVALFDKDGYLPFLQRNSGYWTFPSGKVEEGESHEDAIIRETMEETGIEIAVVEKLGEVTRDDIHLTYFRCAYVSGNLELREPKEFKQCLWASPLEVLCRTENKVSDIVREELREIEARKEKFDMRVDI